MRNGLLAVFLSIGVVGVTACSPGSDNNSDDAERVGNPKYADAQFFRTLDTMLPHPVSSDRSDAPDQFVVTSATWNVPGGFLDVEARTRDEKGTLLTLTGLPESTMIDSFKISSEYGARYRINLANQQAIPCRITVSAGSQVEVVDVHNAPAACENQFQIGGKISDQSLAASRISVIIDGLVFETQAADDGSFELDVYNRSADAEVRILASTGQTVTPVYTGTLIELLQSGSFSASTWAKEILGRRHKRPMLASL